MALVEWNVDEQPQRPLTEADALTLLAHWLLPDNISEREYPARIAELRASLPKTAYTVARECHYMPLALALCAALVRDGSSWASVLDALHKADAKFHKHPHAGVLKALQVSLDALRQQNLGDVRCYLELGVFPEGIAIPEAAVFTLWSQTHGMDKHQTQTLIERLSDKVLIRVSGQRPNRRIELHPVLRMHLQQQSENLQALHSALLKAYQQKCPDGWATGPNDGYFLEYLEYHLKETGRRHEWYELLISSPAWMEGKFGVCLGDTSYSSEVNRAITDFTDPLTADQILILAQLHAALQVWYARVSFFTETDLETLIGLRSEQETLSHTRLSGEPHDQFNELLTIYETQKQSNCADGALLNVLLLLARRIPENWRRASALNKLSVTLTEAGHIDEPVPIPDMSSRMAALRDLAVVLTQAEDRRSAEVFDKAVEAARLIPGNQHRSLGLSALAVILVWAGQYSKASEVVRAISAENRAEALCDLTAALAQMGQFDEAEEVARSIEWYPMRAKALMTLAAALAHVGNRQAAMLFREAGQMAHTISDAKWRAWVLRDLATTLVQAGDEQAVVLFREAVEVAHTISDARSRIIALCDLATALAQARQFDEAIEVTHAISDPEMHMKALHALAVALAQAEQYDEAGKVARSIEWNWIQAKALCVLAVALAQASDGQASEVFHEAGEVAHAIQNEVRRSYALCDLAAALVQAKQFKEAGEIARSIPDIELRTEALNVLAAALAQAGDGQAAEVFHETGETARAIPYVPQRSSALSNLAATLVQLGHFAEGFTMLGRRQPDRFIQEVAKWNKSFDALRPGLSVHILHEVLRIIGWEDPDWHEIYELLSG